MIFEVTEKQIASLNDQQLTELLRKLLIYEAERNKLPLASIDTSLNIKAPDGGLDAGVHWTSGPASTSFLLSRDIGFQCKATDMGPEKCADEIVARVRAPASKDSKKKAKKKEDKSAKKHASENVAVVKPLVDELFARGGDYVLATTAEVGKSGIKSRIKAIRERLIKLKKPYAKSARLHVYPANAIRTWTNLYLPAIVYVQAITGHALVPGLKTWDEWRQWFRPTSPYAPDAKTLAIKQAIRDELKRTGTALRLVGFSGLGKTRLALEATSPQSSTDELNAAVVYFDAGHDKKALRGELSEWRRAKQGAVIVVDNCPSDLHMALQAEVASSDSQMSLLTLDMDPYERLRDQTIFRLEPSDDVHVASVVKSIVKGISEDDAKKIAQLASGFISYAQLLSQAWQERRSIEEALPTETELLSMLWGRGREADKDAKRAIEACALVDSADMGSGDSDEAKFLAAIAMMDGRTLHHYVGEFEQRGLIERHGSFIRVRIYPLALRLCADWWQRCTPQRAAEVLGGGPESIITPLCNRLRMLDFIPQAKSLTEKLCGPQGPFGQAEVLCSDRGARTFRALVELNPNACISALSAVVAKYDYDALRKLEEPRREWVWALERLVFHRDTYARSADVLVRLAIAEFEKYANNATGTLLQTFHVQLAGTEATLGERGKYLCGLFQSREQQVRQIALRGLDSALTTEHYTRTVGAEDQGSGPPLKEYQPKTWDEITNYWRAIIDAAADSVESGGLAAEEVLNVLAGHVRGLVRVGHIPLADYIVQRAGKWKKGVWESGLTALGDISRYEAQGWPAEQKAKLRGWIEALSPNTEDLSSRLLVAVSRPSWSDFYDEEEGKLPSTAERSARLLAEECAKDFDKWLPHLAAVFVGEQRSGPAFGLRLGELVADPEPLIQLALSTLEKHSETGNPVVLVAFVQSVGKRNPKVIDRTMDAFLSTPALQGYAPRILTSLEPSLQTLLTLVDLAKDRAVPPLSLRYFAYGRALSHLLAADAASFASAVYALDEESAPWTALELLYMYCFGESKQLWPEIRPTVREFHMAGRLTLSKQTNQHDSHVWKEAALKLLSEDDPELAKRLATQLIAAYEAGAHSFQVPGEVANKLFDSYGAIVWPIFGEYLVNKPSRGSWALTQYLGRGIRGSSEEAGGPIEMLSHAVIEKWLRANPSGARPLATMIRPLMPRGDDAYEWTPLARVLIDQYGDNKEVLVGLGGNIFSGSWSGFSRAAHYKKIKRLSEDLHTHPKSAVRAWAGGLARDMDQWLARDQRQADARNVGRW